MLRHLLAVVGLLFGLAFSESAAAQPAAVAAQHAAAIPPIAFKTRRLANGLLVITSLDRTTPNVSVQVWYGVGSKNDPAGRSGFAHLFEHMMFKATKDLPAESLDRLTEDVGGYNNASTYDDFTNYFEVVPANHLERLLWAESQRMGSLVVDEANFKSERDVVKEELRQRVLATPYGRLFALYLPQATYKAHPYRRPGIGSIAELDAATIDDVRDFHQAFYRPDNAALIVVGNFDEAKLESWIAQYFAPLKNPASPLQRVTTVEPPRTGPGVFNGYGPNVPLPALAITWLGPNASDPDAPALQVLDAILSGGKSSRLYNSLVYDARVAAEVFSSADLPEQPGSFMVGAIMASGHDVDEGERALLAEVERLRASPPSAAELAEAKNELITGKLRQRETIEGRGFALGYALRIQGDPARANADLAAYAAVTAADVQRVAQKHLAPERRMTIRYRSEAERPKGAPQPAEPPPPKRVVKYTGPVFSLAPPAKRQAPPPIGAPVHPVLPNPVERTLTNGLRVIVAQSSDLPLVTADLTVKTGAWADAPELAGAAGMTANMLTEGAANRSAQEVAREIEALGATLESGAGLESSSVTLNAMPDKLAPAMSIMADVVRRPAFAAEELERQRQLALDSLQVAYQSPGQVAGFAAAPVIYAGTPFGHVAEGTPRSLSRLKPADLVAIHQAWYRPDNAILVFTGDIAPERAFRLAEQMFGDWPKPAAALPPPPTINPDPAAAKAVVIDLPGTGQAAVAVVKPGVARTDPNYYMGLVANTVLGGGYSARLNAEIRIKRGLSYGASSRLSPHRTTGAFTASAQTRNDAAPQVVELIKAEMKKLAAAAPDEEELKARKSLLVGAHGRRIATTGGLADILGDFALYGLPLDELARYTQNVEAVRPAEVQAFAGKVMRPEAASVIVAGDAKAFLGPLKNQLPNVEVIPIDQLDLDSPTLRKPRP